MRPVNVDEQYDTDDRPLVGGPDSIVADVQAYADAGLDRLYHEFFTGDVDEQIAEMERFGSEVIASF
jgi:hypothetical protein